MFPYHSDMASAEMRPEENDSESDWILNQQAFPTASRRSGLRLKHDYSEEYLLTRDSEV